MRAAQDALTRGETGNVDAALAAQAAALEQARALARQQGSAQEALRADGAARWIAAAREALARGDLYQARMALAQAQALAAGARALSAEQAGTGIGRGSTAADFAGLAFVVVVDVVVVHVHVTKLRHFQTRRSSIRFAPGGKVPAATSRTSAPDLDLVAQRLGERRREVPRRARVAPPRPGPRAGRAAPRA